MVDFHTHILPGIDDGSDSIATTKMMLETMREQNIHTIVATPHFAPRDEDIYEFLERRQKAVEEVTHHLEGIKLSPAAEVKYCRNMSKVEGIQKAAIGELGYILVEMTYREWNRQVVDDVIAIMDNTGLVPILAHVDRYWNKDTNKYFDRFLDAGVLMQLNVSAFDSFWERRRFIKLISEGKIHLLGSDCHNMTKRKPNLKSGFSVLSKYGLDSQIEANEDTILGLDGCVVNK